MVSLLFVASLLLQFSSSDTLVVRAENAPVWGEDSRLVEELRIGVLEGLGHYTFGLITAISIGPRESVYVADALVPVIRQYDQNGRWIRDIGRSGQGPGEYMQILGMRSLSGGLLNILDPMLGRVTRFANGGFHSSFPSGSHWGSSNIFAIDTAGFLYVAAVLHDVSPPPGVGEERSMGWIRFDPDGKVQDTIPIPPEEVMGGEFVILGPGGPFRPFPVMTVSALSPHGYLVWARTDQYALHRRLQDGRIVRIEREVSPVSVLPEEWEQWNEWSAYFQRRRREGIQSQYGPIPEVKPIIRHLFIDDDGRIWVALYAEAEYSPLSQRQRAGRGDRPSLEWKQPLVWEVIDPRGAFLGRVAFPERTSLLTARGNTVWGVQAGEYDEHYAVRFHLEMSNRER